MQSIARGILLSVVLLGCSRDVRCYPGAVEIDNVCECPSGSQYNAASDGCESAPPTGQVTSDASTGSDATLPSLDAQLPAPSEDAAAPDAAVSEDATIMMPSCAALEIVCDGACVAPNDAKHCGGCAGCGGGDFCQAGTCVGMGCSDGTREAFVDTERFPTVAGCAATWPSSSMLAARQLTRCGNSSGPCNVPFDACAEGWHVCGSTLDTSLDVTMRISQQECDGQMGAFVMALGDQSCTPCSADGNGAACCGSGCVNQHGSCLWPSATRWFGVRNGVIEHCGKIDNPKAATDIGVMCCRNAQ